MPDRLSLLDTSFLLLERDGQPMHIGGAMIFEGPAPAYEELCDHLAARLDRVPRYRQKVRFVPLEISQPIWVDDENFELEFHVRHTAVPAPGGQEELQRLAARLLSQRLDLDRPLWEMWLVEGLEGDRWALINKVHHAMIDGLSGHDIMEVILDHTPQVEDVEPSEWEPRPNPSTAEVLGAAVVDSVARPGSHLAEMLSRISRPREFVQHIGVRTLGGVAAGSTMVRSDTGISGSIGPHRRWGWVAGDLPTIKAVKNAFGGTVNDVILTAVAGGFRDLVTGRGEDPEEVSVTTMIPVSMRKPGDATGGNEVSAMFAALPIEVADPVDRLRIVTERMTSVKRSGMPLTVDSIMGLADFVPPMLFAAAGRVAARAPQRACDTVTTNVPGPQLPLYLLGRELESLVPFVPLGQGMRLSTAIASYNGTINFAVTADYDTVRDLPVMLMGIEKSLEELGRAALLAMDSKASEAFDEAVESVEALEEAGATDS